MLGIGAMMVTLSGGKAGVRLSLFGRLIPADSVILVILSGLPARPRIASAQPYPSRPITIVVPFPAGGATDAIGRILAERTRASLGQAIIIENVGRANGYIGTGQVARVAPDGCTIFIGLWSTFVTNGALYALPYDVLNDLQPITPISSQPSLIVANKTLAADDLIAWSIHTDPVPMRCSHEHAKRRSILNPDWLVELSFHARLVRRGTRQFGTPVKLFP